MQRLTREEREALTVAQYLSAPETERLLHLQTSGPLPVEDADDWDGLVMFGLARADRDEYYITDFGRLVCNAIHELWG